MQTGEQCAEEVVHCDSEGVQPLLTVVELEGGVLLWVLGEGEDCGRMERRVGREGG